MRALMRISSVLILALSMSLSAFPASVFALETPEKIDLASAGTVIEFVGYGDDDNWDYEYGTYAGKPSRPRIEVCTNSGYLSEGTDYTVSYSNNIYPGIAEVTIIGTGNYIGSAYKTFTIRPFDFNDLSIWSGSVDLESAGYAIYTGHATKPKVKVTWKPKGKSLVTLENGTDYTVSYKDNVRIGKATVIVKGTGNFKGHMSDRFIVTPKKTKIERLKVSNNTIRVSWKKGNRRIDGYEVRYAKKKADLYPGEYENGASYDAQIRRRSVTSCSFSGLSSYTKYYVEVRTYTIVEDKKYRSPWSKIKSIKTGRSVSRSGHVIVIFL